MVNKDLSFRILHAAVVGALSLFVWFTFPSLLVQGLGEFAPIDMNLVYVYAFLITFTTVLRIVLKERGLGVVSGVGSGLISALFLYHMTGGGVLSMSLDGLELVVAFQPLLYLLMLSPILLSLKNLWGAVDTSASQGLKEGEEIRLAE